MRWGDGCCHNPDMPTPRLNVRYQVRNGKHLLAASISESDPERISDRKLGVIAPSRASVCGQIHQAVLRGTVMKRREFIRALGGAATATIGAFGIRLRQLIGYDRLRSQPA
jgi:hypothetical protein